MSMLNILMLMSLAGVGILVFVFWKLAGFGKSDDKVKDHE